MDPIGKGEKPPRKWKPRARTADIHTAGDPLLLQLDQDYAVLKEKLAKNRYQWETRRKSLVRRRWRQNAENVKLENRGRVRRWREKYQYQEGF